MNTDDLQKPKKDET